MKGLVPNREQTLLLRAAMLRREKAGEAWAAWLRDQQDPVGTLGAERGGARRLLPMLWRAVERYELPAPGDLRTYLRAAATRDEARHATYRRILGEVLRMLESEAVSFLVVKGASLAEAVYDPPWLRHCHDIDLLLAETDRLRAARALGARGFRPVRHQLGTTAAHLSLRHASGLPVSLHSNLFRLQAFSTGLEALWEASREQAFGASRARAPCAAHSLLHVCGQAALSDGRRQLTWVSDALLLVEKAEELDWEAFVKLADHGGLAAAVRSLVGYLVSELEAGIPQRVTQELERLGEKAGERQRAALSVAARRGGVRKLAGLLGLGPGAVAGSLARELLLPTASFLRWAYGVESRPAVALLYLYHPLRFLALHVFGRLGLRRRR